MKKVTVKVLSGLGLSVLMVSAWAEPVQNANAPLTQQQVSRRVINNVANVEMSFNKGRNNAGIMSFSRLLHMEKAPEPIVVTLCGIVISVKS